MNLQVTGAVLPVVVVPQCLCGAEPLSFLGAGWVAQAAQVALCQSKANRLGWGSCERGALALGATPRTCVQLQWTEQVHWWKHLCGSS